MQLMKQALYLQATTAGSKYDKYETSSWHMPLETAKLGLGMWLKLVTFFARHITILENLCFFLFLFLEGHRGRTVKPFQVIF